MRDQIGYTRLETDPEFVARVRQKYPWWHQFTSKKDMPSGEQLDVDAYFSFGIQRKIVEVIP
jgi:hypothetical protein